MGVFSWNLLKISRLRVRIKILTPQEVVKRLLLA